MNRSVETSANGSGLLAQGACGEWDVTIDEALDRENEWSATLEGPNLYLDFQLRNLKIIPETVRFLEAHLHRPNRDSAARWSETEDTLALGTFGPAAVALVWDDEQPARCFLIIGRQPGAVCRFSLHQEDLKSLLAAWQQVVEDLPQA